MIVKCDDDLLCSLCLLVLPQRIAPSISRSGAGTMRAGGRRETQTIKTLYAIDATWSFTQLLRQDLNIPMLGVSRRGHARSVELRQDFRKTWFDFFDW